MNVFLKFAERYSFLSVTILSKWSTIFIDAQKFKEAFEAARTFNQLLKDGKTDELVYAETVEDIEEKVEDNPDENKTAGGEDGAGEDDEWTLLFENVWT